MRKFLVFLVVLCLAIQISGVAWASIDKFIADSNQFGYQGTVTNITQNLGPYTFPTPRDATVYIVQNAPGSGAYGLYNGSNYILSNWYQHPLSNQNPGFFQLAEDYGESLISATGGWTQNGALWDFNLTVTGADAPYPWSRLWQPDANMAWGGTFTSYTYTLTATGMTTSIDMDGWRYNTTDPTSIIGSFDGSFLSTQAVYGGPYDLTGRDTYEVHLNFDKSYWDGTNWSDTYGGYNYGNYSYFSAPIPEPATIIIWSLLGAGSWLGIRVWRRRVIGVPVTPTSRQPWSDESRMAILQIIEKGCHH